MSNILSQELGRDMNGWAWELNSAEASIGEYLHSPPEQSLDQRPIDLPGFISKFDLILGQIEDTCKHHSITGQGIANHTALSRLLEWQHTTRPALQSVDRIDALATSYRFSAKCCLSLLDDLKILRDNYDAIHVRDPLREATDTLRRITKAVTSRLSRSHETMEAAGSHDLATGVVELKGCDESLRVALGELCQGYTALESCKEVTDAVSRMDDHLQAGRLALRTLKASYEGMYDPAGTDKKALIQELDQTLGKPEGGQSDDTPCSCEDGDEEGWCILPQ